MMQVALLSGLDADGQKKLNSTKDSDHHLNKLLRVLTVRTDSGRERSGIALVGGPHDPKADGSATQRYSPFHAAVTVMQNLLLPSWASDINSTTCIVCCIIVKKHVSCCLHTCILLASHGSAG